MKVMNEDIEVSFDMMCVIAKRSIRRSDSFTLWADYERQVVEEKLPFVMEDVYQTIGKAVINDFIVDAIAEKVKEESLAAAILEIKKQIEVLEAEQAEYTNVDGDEYAQKLAGRIYCLKEGVKAIHKSLSSK